MKKWTIALLFGSCGFAAGIQDEPRQIRVSLQFIEVAHTSLTEMLAQKDQSGPALHAKAMSLSKNGQAKIWESCLLVCKEGQKATIESIQEVLFPTEYEPSDMPSNTPNVAVPKCLVDRKAAAFEPRNVGVTFEIEPTLATNGMIDLRLSPEIVKQLRLETWMEHIDQWGDATYRLPVFESFRIQSNITVMPGKFEFVSALTPKMNTQGPVVTRKILVFVRADLLPVP
jgi:type II secretory pathway component GspD/PulD (secretin)